MMNTSQETENIPKIYIIITIIFIVTIVIATFIGSILFIQDYKARIYGATETEKGKSVEINAIKSKELKVLSSYQKLEQNKYRIPIDKAIHQLAN